LALKIFSVGQDTVLAPLFSLWPEPTVESPEASPTVEPELPSPQATLYRIQLFTSKNMAEAVSVRNEAALDFDAVVRVDFETPYYKVRIGSFATPQDAEAMLKRARQLGYRGAWAVRVRAPEGRD
jgi:cell division protein FtsN